MDDRGMTVAREHVRHLAEHDGVVYPSCNLGCRTRVERDPAAFIHGATAASA